MPIVHPCSLLLENKAFLLQKEKQNIMKTKLLTLLMLFGLFSPLSVYGDNVPTKGIWHDDYYRSVTPAPPTRIHAWEPLNSQCISSLFFFFFAR